MGIAHGGNIKTEHQIPLVVARVPAFGTHGKATGEINQAVERPETLYQLKGSLGIREIHRVTIEQGSRRGQYPSERLGRPEIQPPRIPMCPDRPMPP